MIIIFSNLNFKARGSLQCFEVGRYSIVRIHLFADVLDKFSLVVQADPFGKMQISRNDVLPCQFRSLIVSFLFELFLIQLVDSDDSLSLGDSNGGKSYRVGLNSTTLFILPLKVLLFLVLQ